MRGQTRGQTLWEAFPPMPANPWYYWICFGRNDRIWTCDLYHPKKEFWNSKTHEPLILLVSQLADFAVFPHFTLFCSLLGSNLGSKFYTWWFVFMQLFSQTLLPSIDGTACLLPCLDHQSRVLSPSSRALLSFPTAFPRWSTNCLFERPP